VGAAAVAAPAASKAIPAAAAPTKTTPMMLAAADTGTMSDVSEGYGAVASGVAATPSVAAKKEEEKEEDPVVIFGSDAKSSDVSSYSLSVLKDIMKKSKVKSATISSTARDSTNQARVMYDNIIAHSVEHQKALYSPDGDKVIDVYDASKKAGKTPAQIKEAMKTKIDEIGPEKLSNHGGDQSKFNVFDVAPSSVDAKQKAEFIKQTEADSRVTKFLKPPSDPGFHFEIPPKE
jgi:hypothetical protein